MKILDESVDEIKEALIAFFERNGGHNEVAKKIGGNPQQLLYIVNGRNDPTLKTVMRILRHYPNEVELRRALSLPVMTKVEGDLPPSTPTPPAAAASAPIQESHKDQIIALLTSQLAKADKDKDDLKRQNEKLFQLAHPELFTDQEGIKIESSGHVTAEESYQQYLKEIAARREAFKVDGFVVGETKEEGAKVFTLVSPVPVFRMPLVKQA